MNHNKSPRITNYDTVVTIAVDAQNDFCPEGALAVPNGNEVIAPLNHALAATRALGGIAIATRDWHPRDTPHFDTWPVHCVAGTDGAALHPKLQLEASDYIINKGTGMADGYSGFEGATEDGQTIESIIQQHAHKKTIVAIGGLATDFCVQATVLDALETLPDTDVYVITDAIRAVNIHENDEQKALQAMREKGAHFATSTELFGAQS